MFQSGFRALPVSAPVWGRPGAAAPSAGPAPPPARARPLPAPPPARPLAAARGPPAAPRWRRGGGGAPCAGSAGPRCSCHSSPSSRAVVSVATGPRQGGGWEKGKGLRLRLGWGRLLGTAVADPATRTERGSGCGGGSPRGGVRIAAAPLPEDEAGVWAWPHFVVPTLRDWG